MTVDPVVQRNFERNLLWKKSWPRCFLAVTGTVQILLSLVIFVTEAFNILVEFWHTNVFGGIWGSIILLVDWILIFVTVCCATTVRASTCSFCWNILTLVALGVVIAFDIVFIVNPTTCLLTTKCSNQTQLVNYNYIVQTIPQFSSYTYYDSKKFFLEIQVGCAGLAFVLSIIYLVIFVVCRLRLRGRILRDNPDIIMVPPQRGLRIAQVPVATQSNQVPFVPHLPYY